MREDEEKEECIWTQTGRRGVFSSSVEYHTRLSSGGVEDPVVRARLGSQVRLVLLQVTAVALRSRRGRSRRGLRLRWGHDGNRLFLGRWGGRFLLHFGRADLGFGCW